MARLNDAADQARNTHAIRTHMDIACFAVRPLHLRIHRGGIFITEIEDMPDFDTAQRSL